MRCAMPIYALAAATGFVGTGFHLYNIGKRPGGFCWHNLFYGAPLGAPMALLLSGLLGFCAERVRDSTPGATPTIFDLPAGRTLAAVTGAGLARHDGRSGAAAFPRRLPQSVRCCCRSRCRRSARRCWHRRLRGLRGRDLWFTRWWLRLLAAMGFAGVGFHAYGVSRNMGGWRNWSQNVLNGPPLPAPPSFTGLALAGLAALGLMEDHPDA